MKKAILLSLFCCSFIFLNAQLDKPDYFIFDIGKQTINRLSKTLYDDRNSLLLNVGMGYEYPINDKWSWSSEFLLAYRRTGNERSSLIREDGGITGIELIRHSVVELELNIPLYLKRKLGNGLTLIGGLSTNFALVDEYAKWTTTINESRSGTGGIRNSDWFEGLQITGNLGLQVPISNYADLRFNLQQPVWTASFRGLGNGFYRFSNLRFTFGINYKLGSVKE